MLRAAFLLAVLVQLHKICALRMNVAITPHKSGVIVIGSGPTGLATAIMLAKRGYQGIKVYDKLAAPPSPSDSSVWSEFSEIRSYNIGLSGRGQNALKALGVMDRIQQYTADVVGRKDWTPESKVDEPIEVVYTDRTYPTRVIQRDRLTGVLLEEINTKYNESIKVAFNTICESAHWINTDKDTERCRLTFKDTSNTSPLYFYEESNFVLGADGANSAVREAIAKTTPKNLFNIQRFTDKNVRIYRTIPLHFPNDPKKWRKDLNYSVRLKSDINMDALPTKEGLYLGVVLYRPWDDRISLLKNKDDAKAFFDSYFPMLSPCLKPDDLDKFAKKEASTFPKFSYVGPNLHKGRTTALLGDCIHSVKPFFGLGVNSAFEDVVALNTALDKTQDDIPKALKEYSKMRAVESKELVSMSRQLDGGFFTFILPLIIDSILHKALPKVFSPNTIASMQNEKRTFRDVARRKILDRVMQLILATSFVGGVGKLLFSIGKVLKSLVLSKVIRA